jgi:cytochrome d ubiquinol oxidase subunit II
MSDLAFIWAGIIAFAVLAYVVLDGFDLGLGILFPWFPSDRERTTLLNTIAPVWDGNETWLVLGGGGLMAAFPLAYAVVMPALYAPIIAMLLALIFRGVAFEFRGTTQRGRRWWDMGFWLGSTVAALAQGIALGTLVQGIKVSGRAYAGGWWDWLSPFSVLTGGAVVVGYAALGATWVLMRTEGDVQARARPLAIWASIGLFVLLGAVSLWTPFLIPLYRERWFGFPQIIYTSAVPILVALDAVLLWHALTQRRDGTAFLAVVGLFVLSFIGLGISFFPYIVPVSIRIGDAAAPDASLSFVLVGAAVLVPLILVYTAHSYWVFRGKVTHEGGYH